jgi:hypothetical protein
MKNRSSIPNVNEAAERTKSRKGFREATSSPVTKTQSSIDQVLIESSSPSQEEIAKRARIIWEQEGQPVGRDEEIWLRAENELKEELSGSRFR